MQTNAWSDELHGQDLPQILTGISGAGYSGFEIGAHRVNLERPGLLRDLATRHGLTVLGLHSGAGLWDPTALADMEAHLAHIAAFSVAVGAAFVPVSSRLKEDKTARDCVAETEALNRLGRVCAGHGLRLAYHNHDWEVLNDYQGLRTICDQTDPRFVSLLLDVGWVRKGGGDPMLAASLFLDRIAYFHLKDTLDDWFTELGCGAAGLDALGAFLQARWDGWLVVERDKVMDQPADGARVSREYLRTQWGV